MPIGRNSLPHTLLALTAIAASCGQPDDDDENCDGDRCSSAPSREALLQSIEGFSDPISEYLRASVREDGTLPGDYREVVAGMAQTMGCEEDDAHSFLVLSNEALNPKAIFTECSSAPVRSSEFFLLVPELADDKDFEPQLIHMVAWDSDAGEYRRFATAPHEDGGMSVNVQPVFCLSCHGGPRELGTWQPLMNEMTNPWSQWNAEPGFRSHSFDDFLPSASAEGDVFGQISAEGLLESASELEPIIRAGIDRVTGARMQRRHDSADVSEALELLQPLFCDEQANYVSEIHESGELRSSAVIDDSVRELLIALDIGDDLDFVQNDTMRIAPVSSASEENLTLLAVRGESSLRSELALVTRQVLSPGRVLQVRSLDWQRPVDSEFRCKLFDDASQRIAAGVLDDALGALAPDATNADLLPLLLDEAMTLVEGERRISLAPTGDTVYSVPDASAANFEALGERERSFVELAAEMQAALDGATRESLEEARVERACRAASRYLIAPIVPGIDC